MLSFVANSLVTPVIARKLARVIPNPFVRTIAIAAVGYGINHLLTQRANRQIAGTAANRALDNGPRYQPA